MIELVRVTEVLDWISRGEMAEWRGKVGNAQANKIGREARKWGTEVDEAVSALLSNKNVPKLKSEETKLAWKAWNEWWALQNLEGPRTIQTRLTNEEYGITGQPDFHVPGELFDWKVSKWPKWTWHWQMNVYLWLLGRLEGRYRVIQLHPLLGTWDEHKGVYSKTRLYAFLGLVEAYRQWKMDTAKEEPADDTADREIEADQEVV